jgi:arsenical pump membrane protein
MFACTFIADTASFLLPVANPINILVGNAFGIGLGPFLHHLLLTALFCILANVGIFLWRFRGELRGGYDLATVDEALAPPSHRPFFRFVVGGLAIIAAGYVLASAQQWPVSLVALGGSALLLAGAAWYRRIDWRALAREVSWSIFLFIAGMFVLVRGVENLGLTQAFGALLLNLTGQSTLGAVASTAVGTALGANLVNNVPMALIMVSAIRAQSALPTPLHNGAVYAAIFGADLGPNLTTVGSLATMLWLLILRRKGLEVSTKEYLKLGLTVVPVMLLGGVLLIWLQL